MPSSKARSPMKLLRLGWGLWQWARRASPAELLDRAEAKVESDATEAVKLCDRVLAGDPNDGRAREIRGRALAQLGRTDEAWTDLECAVGAGRRSAALFRARWVAQQNAGRYEAALTEIDQAIAIAPQTADL